MCPVRSAAEWRGTSRREIGRCSHVTQRSGLSSGGRLAFHAHAGTTSLPRFRSLSMRMRRGMIAMPQTCPNRFRGSSPLMQPRLSDILTIGNQDRDVSAISAGLASSGTQSRSRWHTAQAHRKSRRGIGGSARGETHPPRSDKATGDAAALTPSLRHSVESLPQAPGHALHTKRRLGGDLSRGLRRVNYLHRHAEPRAWVFTCSHDRPDSGCWR